MSNLYDPEERREAQGSAATSDARHGGRDEVDLLRHSVHPFTGTAPQGVGHDTRRRALERLRHPPPPAEAEVRVDRRRRVRRYLLTAIIVAVVALAGFLGWTMIAADRGVILHLGDEPLPGQSGRIALHSIERIADPAELRASVDEETGAIILEADRIDDLGREWLAEQHAEGIAIVSIGDRSALELGQTIGVEQRHGAASGVTNTTFSYLWRACDGSGESSGSVGGPYHFNSMRHSLTSVLDKDDRRC